MQQKQKQNDAQRFLTDKDFVFLINLLQVDIQNKEKTLHELTKVKERLAEKILRIEDISIFESMVSGELTVKIRQLSDTGYSEEVRDLWLADLGILSALRGRLDEYRFMTKALILAGKHRKTQDQEREKQEVGGE